MNAIEISHWGQSDFPVQFFCKKIFVQLWSYITKVRNSVTYICIAKKKV